MFATSFMCSDVGVQVVDMRRQLSSAMHIKHCSCMLLQCTEQCEPISATSSSPYPSCSTAMVFTNCRCKLAVKLTSARGINLITCSDMHHLVFIDKLCWFKVDHSRVKADHSMVSIEFGIQCCSAKLLSHATGGDHAHETQDGQGHTPDQRPCA